MSGSLAYLRDKWTNEGRQDGWNEGHQDGWNGSTFQYVQRLTQNLQTTTKEALKLLNIPEEEYEAAKKAVEAKNNHKTDDPPP